MLIAMRRAVRRWTPWPLRLGLALARRRWRDRGARFARQLGEVPDDWCRVVGVEQEIKRSEHWLGKLANLELGASLLDGVRIESGQVLSFWALIGRPSAARGFAVGRAIRADAATGDVGGGLCQLSGLIYELGLRGGLEIVERHPHSRDLYQSEDERFTPLGLDATVVWPWKDLRLRNRLAGPVALRLTVRDMKLRGDLCAAVPLDEARLRIERADMDGMRAVEVWRDGRLVSTDRYTL